MVESQPSKLLVAGPIPVSRSIFSTTLQRFYFSARHASNAWRVGFPLRE